MNYTALSLNQTPPLSVPLPYFLAAPLFLATAALVLLLGGPELLLSRWSPAMLALTHLITIGFLGTVMIGAVQQLVPVLIGVPLPAPRLIAWGLLPLWLFGAGLLIVGMGLSSPLAVQAGGGLLGVAVLLFLLVVLRSNLRSDSRHATRPAMVLALLALGVAISLALYLIWHYQGRLPLAHPLTALHIGWGAVGWLFLLLVGVSYQVVPMFQITPEYPLRLRRWLAPLIWLALLLWSAGVDLLDWAVAAGVLLFAMQTLWLQAKRRRRLSDVTLDFWRLAMGCLILAVVVWAVPQLELLTGVLFFIGFAVSAVSGMLYKIVPFLIWLHLNNRLQQAGIHQGGIPNMKQVIPERLARWQFRLHLLALVTLIVLLLWPSLPQQPAALLWLADSLFLGWNLWQAQRLYRRILRERLAPGVA